MSAEAKEIKVKLNHNYGTKNGEYDFKYDQSFGSFFAQNEYAKNRAGYVFNALYNGSTKVDDSTIFSAEETNANQENSFWLCFPNTTDVYTFEWTASELSNPININFAIANAKAGDIIVLAGKGHETYQIIGTETIHLDEREVIAEALSKG